MNLKPGQRIELVSMSDDPHPIPTGTRGTVTLVTPVVFRPDDAWDQVSVEWDNGRTLMLAIPPDRVQVVPGPGQCQDCTGHGNSPDSAPCAEHERPEWGGE